jgi:hypothetical protein
MKTRFKIIIAIVALSLMAAVTPMTISKVQGLQAALDAKVALSVADARYPAKGDTVTLTNYFYTKTEIDPLVYKQELQNLINNATGINYRFPVLANSLGNTNIAMTDGRRLLIRVDIKSSFSTSGVSYSLTTAGSYTQITANEKNAIYLYSWSAGSVTPIDSIANARQMWGTDVTANTLVSKNWKGGAHTLTPGIYYIGWIFNGTVVTTAPSIAIFSNVQANFATMFFPANAQPVIYQNTQTALPNTTTSIATGWSNSTSIPCIILNP